MWNQRFFPHSQNSSALPTTELDTWQLMLQRQKELQQGSAGHDTVDRVREAEAQHQAGTSEDCKPSLSENNPLANISNMGSHSWTTTRQRQSTCQYSLQHCLRQQHTLWRHQQQQQ
ncbi:hypothetical protein FRB95_002440 [Tulasnella sp. JGI-2019a]|nr:hypothetical protein FRB95_002440 [Tulasnella sp. JGI-2019a]